MSKEILQKITKKGVFSVELEVEFRFSNEFYFKTKRKRGGWSFLMRLETKQVESTHPLMLNLKGKKPCGNSVYAHLLVFLFVCLFACFFSSYCYLHLWVLYCILLSSIELLRLGIQFACRLHMYVPNVS